MIAGGSVLVIRLSALGDVLFTMPAVDALRRARPDLAIDWLVEERAATLLDLYPGLRRRIVWRRGELQRAARSPLRWPAGAASVARHLTGLREARYDCVLDFQGNLKSGAHALLARGRRKVGFARSHSREANWLLHRESVTPPAGAVHRVEQALALVRAVEPAAAAEARPPALAIPDSSRDFARAALAQTGIGDAPFVVLQPGTSKFGAFKRWRADRFANVADLMRARGGIRALVTWGPGEEELARSVAASCKSDGALVSPPTRSLADLAALLERARLVIASDSGALHLAAFLGTPIVALYGPKDPRLYGPRFAPMRIVHTWLPCSPCTRRECPDVLCMEEISVRQVVEAAESLLKETAPRRD
jgi:3-deoxy-D-manno-octulosonic-acid transferase/heptosyltransferase-1